MTTAADLLSLQDLDLRRDSRRATIADIESRLGETQALRDARQAVEDAERDLRDLQSMQRTLEGRLEDLDARIQPLEKRMYDGSVRNPKELTDMQRELEHLKAQRSQLDDDGLEVIDAVDAATRLLEQRREALKRTEAAWQEDQAALQQDKAAAEREFTSLEDQRQAKASEVDRTALGLYESLRGARGGRAVAVVERGACQGCRITLPTHMVQRLRGSETLVQCPSCERILVAA